MDGSELPQPVLTEVIGQTLVITLNRPEVRNAVNTELAVAVGEALDRLDGDPQLVAGVLTGSGKGFSAGADLKAILAGEGCAHPVRGFGGITRIGARKPTIAAVEGFALAGGFEIALACDLIVAAHGARFGLPEVTRGLVASAGGVLRLPTRVPRALAAEMILTGEPVTSERLMELGAINRIVAPGAALEAALELARMVARGGPLGVAASKRILDESPEWDGSERWARQDEIVRAVLESDDIREGAAAFVERRPPVWRGR
jgi:enoyl-CoA hydratase